MRQDLQPKLVSATVNVLFDFTSDLGSDTISTKSVAATVYSGTDASPSSVISGAASHSVGVVTQKITGGVAGVIYELLCTITTAGSLTLTKSAYLAVIPDLV